MFDHHIQKSIIYRLAFADTVSFTNLKPDDLDNKLFTYHLKKVIARGFVEKTAEGAYQLTAKGRRVGKGALERDDRFIDRAYSVLLLVIKDTTSDSWLLHTRETQPLRGLTGLLQARPLPDSSMIDIATHTLTAQTGLSGDFSIAGQAFFTFIRSEQLESFIHATILVGQNITGVLQTKSEAGEYAWVHISDFSAPGILPTVSAIAAMLASNQSFTERTFHVDEPDSAIE
jgi:hypothetical protein